MSAIPTASTPAPSRQWPARIGAAAVTVAILALAWIALDKPREVASFERPDHHYKVVVLRRPTWWRAAMPGQSADAPGLVRLHDRSGRLLQEAPVEMVQIVEGVEWQDRRVTVKLVATWSLPD